MATISNGTPVADTARRMAAALLAACRRRAVVVGAVAGLLFSFVVAHAVHSREDGILFPTLLFSSGVVLTLLAAGSLAMARARQSELEESNRNLIDSPQALGERRARLREIIDLVPHMVFAKDREGRFLWLNRCVAEVYGVPREDLIGMPHADLHQGDAETDRAFIEDREVVDVGERWFAAQQRFRDAHGRERTLETTKIPYTTGELQAVLTVAIDVTDRCRAQETAVRLEREMLHAHKMETVVMLAGGIAHQFNNILGAMMGYTELAMTRISDNPRALANLEEVMSAGNDAVGLVKQILAFSRKSDGVIGAVDSHDVVDEVVTLLRASLPMSIEVRSSLDRDAGVVIGDAAELHHVVMNVCTNAYQAIDDAVGTLCVELQAADLDADAAARLNVEPGPYVHVRVTDTGKGMDEETKARAFDPFFTTKPVGAGVGMGLSTVYGIVTKLGGTVVLASAPGHGTSVDLYLPRACESELAVPDAGLGTTAGGERILVVDDEARVLEMLRQMMEQLGYRVTAVNSAVEALDVFRRQPDVFDVVITDQTMPAMTGVELARALREIRSDLPIVIATGHAISGMNAKATGLSGYVSKPYLVQDLSRAVQEALRPHPAVGV